MLDALCILFLANMHKLNFPEHTMIVGVVVLAPGAFHTILVREDGSVWSTGVNIDGQMQLNFVKVLEIGATAAAVSNHNSIVLQQSGTVWVTGKATKERLFFLTKRAVASALFRSCRASLVRKPWTQVVTTAWC